MTALVATGITIGMTAVVVAPPGASAATKPGPKPKAVLAQNATTPTPNPHATPAGLAIGVAIFPDAQAGLKNAAGTDAYDALAAKLNGLGPFRAWIVDTPCKFAGCRLSDARIYIYGKQIPAISATPADKPASLTLTSFFAGGAQVQRIDSVPLTITTAANGDKIVADASADQLRTLIGHLAFDDQFNIVATTESAALQLVPSPVNEADPDYEPILEHILGTFGVPAVRSRIPANALRGPSDSTTCPGAQRYFVYRVRMEEYPNRLMGHTRLTSYAEGFILDCTAPNASAAASGTSSHNVPTTSTLLTDLGALAVAFWPKATSRQLTLGTNAFSKLVDVDPKATDVRDSVASAALAQLANNMCVRLLQLQPSASPSPSPPAGLVPPPTPRSTPYAIARASAEPLLCKKRLPYRPQSRGSARPNVPYEAIYDQWHNVTPTPTPNSAP